MSRWLPDPSVAAGRLSTVTKERYSVRMELSYVSIRQRVVPILFWSAIGFAGFTILLALGTNVPMPVAATLITVSALFTLWVHWQNGRGGFGSIRGMHATYETRARLSPGQWFLLLLVMIVQAGVLSFLLVS